MAIAAAAPGTAGDDPCCGRVLVAGVFETAVGDRARSVEIHLVASGLGAPIAAFGAVVVDVCLVAAVGYTELPVHLRPGNGDSADSGQYAAAALTEPLCGHDGHTAVHTLHPLTAHNLVLGRIAFAFSTKVMRSHTSVASCASAR